MPRSSSSGRPEAKAAEHFEDVARRVDNRRPNSGWGDAYHEEFLDRDEGLRATGGDQPNHLLLGYADGIQNSYKEIEATRPAN